MGLFVGPHCRIIRNSLLEAFCRLVEDIETPYVGDKHCNEENIYIWSYAFWLQFCMFWGLVGGETNGGQQKQICGLFVLDVWRPTVLQLVIWSQLCWTLGSFLFLVSLFLPLPLIPSLFFYKKNSLLPF